MKRTSTDDLAGVDPDYEAPEGETTGDLDDLYLQMNENVDEEVAERKVGTDPLPKFDDFVLQINGGKYKKAKTGNVGMDLSVKVIEGPEGTVGRVVFVDTIYLAILKTKQERQTDEETGKTIFVSVPRTQEEYDKARGKFDKTFNRVAAVLGTSRLPASYSEEDVTTYITELAEAGAFIGAISRKKGGTNEETGEQYQDRNTLQLQSIETLGGPGRDRKGNAIPGKSALDVARERIIAYNKRQEKKTSPSVRAGRVAGGSQPTDFYPSTQ